MADLVGGIFDRIVISFCDFQHKYSSIASVSQSQNVKYIALLLKNGIFQVFANGDSSNAIFELENVQCFAGWQAAVGHDANKYCFAVETFQRELNFYEFQNGKWDLVHVIFSSLLRSLLDLETSLTATDDFPPLRFLGHQGLHQQLRLTVATDDCLFVLQKYSNSSWESMPIPIKGETLKICTATACQTKCKVYAMSNNFQTIHAFSLSTGSALNSWPIQSLTCVLNHDVNLPVTCDSSSRISVWESVWERRFAFSDSSGRIIVTGEPKLNHETENGSREMNHRFSVARSSSISKDDESIYRLATSIDTQSISSRGGSISSFTPMSSVATSTRNKKLQSVTGFNKSATSVRSGVPSTSWRCRVLEPKGTITAFELGAESLAVLYGCGDLGEESAPHGAFSVLDVDNMQEIAFSRFQEETAVAFGSGWSSPHLFVTKGSVIAFPCIESQANIISKLMLFESGAHVEALARVNEWDTVSVPLGVLVRGLKHRLADAVAFYLKTKDNVVIGRPEHETLSELDTIAGHLVVAIQENMAEIGARRFAQHLLCISIDFFNRLLRNTVRSDLDSAAISRISKEIMKYLTPMRTLLKNYPARNSLAKQGIGLEEAIEQMPSLNAIWENWTIMQNVDDVIRDGIVNNLVPAIQGFLLQQGESQNSLEMVFESGLLWARESLVEKNIDLARRILTTLGVDPVQKLREICFSSSDKILREYLIEEMRKDGSLSRGDVVCVDFLHQVETYYSCRSFESCRSLPRGTSYWEMQKGLETDQLRSKLCEDVDGSQVEFGEIGKNDSEVSEDGEYSHLTLDWVQQLSLRDMNQVLMEAFLISGSSELPVAITADIAWDYLLEHADTKRLVTWIEAAKCGKELDVERGFLGEITQTMVDRVHSLAPSSSWNEILNSLAKLGLFATQEIEDFSCTLSRLNKSQLLLNLSEKVGQDSPVGIGDFKNRLLQYCVQHGLGHALFHFLDRFGMSSQCLTQFLEVDDAPSWLVMLAKFKEWSEKRDDADCLYLASVSCVELSSDVSNPTVKHLVRNGGTLAAIASLLYVPGSIAGAVESVDVHSDIADISHRKSLRVILDDAFSSYPSLSRCLRKEGSETDSSMDNLYYILLQDNTPLDVSCLFGWQMNNHLKCQEAFADLPHFAHPEYVSAYGHRESPDITYYLTNARPGFALSYFVVSEMKSHGHITDVSICELANDCVHLAIHHIDDPQIVASCVALLEMLGKSSHFLRVVFNSANCAIQNSSALPSDDNYLDLRKILQTAHNDRNLLTAFTLHLESVILKQALEGSSGSSFDSVLQLGNVVKFCRLYDLPYPLTFLRNCAEDNDWLLFFVCVQIFCYPHHQVLNAVRQFRDVSLSEHLLNALSKPQFRCVRRKTKPKKEKTPMQRDSRNALYSRMGFSKQGSQQPAKAGNVHIGSPDGGFSLASETDESSAASCNPVIEEIQNDLLGTVLRCHKTSHPWLALMDCAVKVQNPLLAVLAACYKECPVVHAMCSWIDSCGGHHANQEICNLADLQGLQMRIKDMVQRRRLALLAAVFQIFQPECPLLHLLASINELIVKKSPSCSSQHMKKFENALQIFQEADCRNASFTRSWIDEMQDAIVSGCLNLCEENHSRISFLEILILSRKSHAYCNLLELHRLLEDTDIMIDLTSCAQGFHNPIFETQHHRIVTQLVSEKRYETAYKFARLCGLQCDRVIILQMEDELKCYGTSKMTSKHDDQHFWKKCVRLFAENNVCSHDAAKFFLEAAGEMSDPYDKCIALRLTLAFLNCSSDQGSGITTEMATLERDMWYAWIQTVDRNLNVGTESPVNFLEGYRFSQVSTSPVELKSRDILVADAVSTFAGMATFDLTTNELTALDRIIGNLVDQGNVQKAIQLCKYFNHQSQCIYIIQTCLHLASGDLLPRDLDLSKKFPTLRASRSRTTSLTIPLKMSRSLSSSSISSFSTTALQVPEVNSEILELMETLLQHCDHGSRYCAGLIAYYKISLALGQSFSDVFSCHQDSFFLLQKLLLSDSLDRFLIAKDFIATKGLSAGQVASFLRDQIIWTLRVYCGSVSNVALHLRSASDLIFRPTDSPSSFAQLIKLCQDPSMLGFMLLQAIETREEIAGGGGNSLKVEILVCAHSCFTASCNVEGITRSLKMVKEFSQALAKIGEFILIEYSQLFQPELLLNFRLAKLPCTIASRP